jgi:ABC-type sugar transport system permease subunit
MRRSKGAEGKQGGAIMQVSVDKKSERKAAYLFIIPAVVLLAAFLLYPALQTVRYAFTDYNIMRPDRIKFCGFNNFIELFQDKDFWIAVKNTLHFTILVVPFQTVLALALALLISSRRKGVSIFRAAYFSPQVTSMVVVAILWTVLYNSNPNSGLLNALLVNLGMEPCGFLNDPKSAMNSIVFMSAWQGAGYQMMIFLAGLQGIPKDQYEAASIDGAGKIKSFLYVTLPGLKNVISYVIMITVIQAMKLFTQPYVMTKGGPQNATRTLVYYVYEQGFQKRNFGYACAVAAVFFVIVISLSVGMKKIIKA